MPERQSAHPIATFFLVALVIYLNVYIHVVRAADASHVVPHVYYGVLILAGLYSGRIGQYLLLALTSLANVADAIRFDPPPIYFATVALFPLVGWFILRAIASLQRAREQVNASLTELEISHDALEKRVLELTALLDIGVTAASTLDLEKLFQQIMRVLADKLGMYWGTLSLWDQQSQLLRVEAAYGLTEAEKRRGRYMMGEGITDTVMATGQPIAVKNLGGEPLFLNKMGARELNKDEIAFLCVPVSLEGETLGTLSVDKALDRFSLEDDLRVLTIVASVIAQAVKINQMIAARVDAERFIVIGKMATTVAHEVRNPLGGIRGAAQLLESELPSDSPAREYLQVILTEVDRLNQVIEDLLTLGRPAPLRLESHDLRELLKSLERMYAAQFAKHHIAWELEIPENVPPLTVDAGRCLQVFHNLVHNAIEAMPQGGRLRVRVIPHSEEVHIQFCDTGVGIAPDARERLFDPFYTTKPKGTGLGLAVCQRILQEHQGRIEWKPSEGEGTCFTVILPWTPSPTSQTPQETPPPPAQ